MKKKNIFNALFLILITAITMYCIFSGRDLGDLLDYLKKADLRYWLASVGCVLIFILSESWIIRYLMKKVGQKPKNGHCILYSFVGFFFSCVTPGASGGQPAQVVYMKRDGLPFSVSTLVLLVVTISYKFVLILLGLFVLIIKPRAIMLALDPVIGWCYLGIVLNVVCVAGMMLLIFHTELAKRVFMWGVKVAKKLHLMRQSERLQKKIENSVSQYEGTSGFFRENPIVILKVFLMTCFQRFMLFFVTFLVYHSFGMRGAPMMRIVLLQGMISVAVDMLPLPGGVGITESLFAQIFEPIMGEFTIPALIISRGINYYSQLIMSAVMTGVAHLLIGKKGADTDPYDGLEEK